MYLVTGSFKWKARFGDSGKLGLEMMERVEVKMASRVYANNLTNIGYFENLVVLSETSIPDNITMLSEYWHS